MKGYKTHRTLMIAK